MLTKIEIENLISSARNAQANAFAHRSGHKFGSALLTTDGQVFAGCNTEAVISGLGVCAERSAIDHAVIHGKYEYKALLVVDKEITFPCGACLQYLFLFYQITSQDIEIYAVDSAGNYQMKTLTELLPSGYQTKTDLDIIKSFKNK
ncbi:cytidine deaminase [Candidatus Shapirobacteria bacterium]|nr:cytidine deaminase [Candidatus Shapirobacteria bacterium]